MIWIHGGSYHSGYSQKYSAWKVATEQDVVVVVVQYRLGALGFLSSGDSTLPGAYSMTMMVVMMVMIVMWYSLGFLSSGDSTLPGAYSMTMMVVMVVMIVMWYSLGFLSTGEDSARCV